MCTLAIYFQASAELPVVVAANRDEFYERPATAPRRLVDDPWIVAGQDQVAGGTWLGINAHRMVSGIVNRRSNRPADPTRRSRGQLCLDVLRQPSVAKARAQVCADRGNAYNPFNLLIASPEEATLVGNADGVMCSRTLRPGLHLLTNLELNDFECPRIAKSYALFEAAQRELRPDTLPQFVDAVRTILSDHSTPLDPRAETPANNLCMHSERFGTRSSCIIVYAAAQRAFRMWHADGPPCRTSYLEIPLP